jgi:hypothetical protein
MSCSPDSSKYNVPTVSSPLKHKGMKMPGHRLGNIDDFTGILLFTLNGIKSIHLAETS